MNFDLTRSVHVCPLSEIGRVITFATSACGGRVLSLYVVLRLLSYTHIL